MAVLEQWADDYCAEFQRVNGMEAEVVLLGRGRYQVYVNGHPHSGAAYRMRDIVEFTGRLRRRADGPCYRLTDKGRAMLKGGE